MTNRINKYEIARLVIQLNYGQDWGIPTIIREIDRSIQWAWDNWDDDIINTYYTGEKPSLPTEVFIYEWVENEDFQADGFDMEELLNLF